MAAHVDVLGIRHHGPGSARSVRRVLDETRPAVVKDLVRRSDHALLVVRAAGRMLVLDNGTNLIVDAEDARDYRPVLTFSANGAWTHGYRRMMPPMTVAAATIAPLTPSASPTQSD